jgi:ankyrin repeat protein
LSDGTDAPGVRNAEHASSVTIDTEDPLAIAVTHAIHQGDRPTLKRLLEQHPFLPKARLGDDSPDGMSRTLLHVATDWPGQYPNVGATISLLIESGAEPNARFRGPHSETPLHWAASSDDVQALDALLDGGADIDADGGVIGHGTPLADARAFAQWNAADRLVERGAQTTFADEATLGLIDRLSVRFASRPRPSQDETSRAFWGACHGGQQAAAEYLLYRGADLNWIPPWENLTPLDAAKRRGADDLVQWLTRRGARSAANRG